MDSEFQTWFQRRFRNPTSPFATHGLPRNGYPAFKRYYGDAKTASARLLRLRIKLGARYPGVLSLSWRPGAESPPPIQDLVEPVRSESGVFPRKQEALMSLRSTLRAACGSRSPLRSGSQLPWRPQYCFALLFDPGRTSTPDHCGASVLPPLSQPRRLRRSSFFRGSFTRLCSSLPTLEGVISESPAKARFRWSVRPFRAGRYPPGLDRGFLMLVRSFLLSFVFFWV